MSKKQTAFICCVGLLFLAWILYLQSSEAQGNYNPSGQGSYNVTSISGVPIIPSSAHYDNGVAYGYAQYMVSGLNANGRYYAVIPNNGNDSVVLPDTNGPGQISVTGFVYPINGYLQLTANNINSAVGTQVYAVTSVTNVFTGWFYNVSMLTNTDVFQLWGGPNPGSGNVLQWGAIGGVSNLAFISLNTNHGGYGNGTEWDFEANAIAITGIQSGVLTPIYIQLGGQGQTIGGSVLDLQVWGTPATNKFSALSGLIDWNSQYWNGSGSTEAEVFEGIVGHDTSGNATLTLFDEQAPSSHLGIDYTKPHRQDRISGVGVKNYGAWIMDNTNLTPGSVYFMNFAMMSQTMVVTQATTLSITNWSVTLTNTANSTASGLVSDMYLFSGSSQTLTWSIPAPLVATWESEAGGASAPTSVNGILHVRAYIVVANSKTNIILNAKH